MSRRSKQTVRGKETSPAMRESRPAGLSDRWAVFGICMFLVAVIWVVFGQTARFGFVNYDDDLYVYENPVVQQGLTWNGALWALRYGKIGHWHPLTWLTHMADCQVYGLWAGGHHLTNVALHTVTTVLLFLVLRAMTGALWRSGFVAAVFAIHPLRAESVAWVSERKDVLSGMFFMLTLWAYVAYVEKQKASAFAKATADRESRDWNNRTNCAIRRGRKFYYGLTLVFFALGLLAKNMLVTVPFVLLVLDWWPLGRLKRMENREWRMKNEGSRDKVGGGVAFWGLVREKIPLLLLSAGSCLATALVPEKVGAYNRVTALERAGNGLVSCVIYLRQMIFPAGLAIPYPNVPNGQPPGKVCLAFVILAAISAGVMACRKKRPCVLMGWLWYLGMLVPVIGIVQISNYAHADRYTYLPEIGLALAGTWAVADWSQGWKHRRVILGGLMMAVIGALSVCGDVQTSYWKDSQSLCTRALSRTLGNSVAHLNLGLDYVQKGNLNEAIKEFRKAVEINPDYADGFYNLGDALALKGDMEEAIAQFRKALEINPAYEDAHINLGNALANDGKLEEAIAQYQKAVEINPADENLRDILGAALLRNGDVEGAIAQYQKALETNPADENVHNNLGNALFTKGQLDEAIAQYQKALETNPNYAEARYNLGTALASKGNLDDALAQYRKVLEIRPDYAKADYNVGKLLLLKGDFDEAMACLEKTISGSQDPLAKWYNFGNEFLQEPDWDCAIACYRQALKINPGLADAYANLGVALSQKGEIKKAVDTWEKALEIKPDQLYVLNNLAWLLATTPDGSLRDGAKAVALAAQANQLSGGGNPMMLHTLAAAYAEEGNYGLATVTARRGLELAVAERNEALAATLQKEIQLY
ncbi:MAG: tetratricopeptide repeat protein, partial [Verrucomicrobiota bacterium]